MATPNSSPTDDYLERFADEYFAAIASQTQPSRPEPIRKRTRMRSFSFTAGGLATVLAVAAVAVVLVGPSTGGRLDAVAEAREALVQQPNEILHIVTRSSFGRPGDQPEPVVTERWSSKEPFAWRMVRTLPNAASRDRSDRDGPISGPEEYAYAGGELRYFVKSRDTLRVTTGVLDADAEMPPIQGDAALRDPTSEIEGLLQSGDLQETPSGSEDIRVFIGSIPSEGDPTTVTDLRYEVDANTFAPLRVTATRKPKDPANQRPTTEAVVEFVKFENLDPTAENKLQLVIQTGPDTQVRTEQTQ